MLGHDHEPLCQLALDMLFRMDALEHLTLGLLSTNKLIPVCVGSKKHDGLALITLCTVSGNALSVAAKRQTHSEEPSSKTFHAEMLRTLSSWKRCSRERRQFNTFVFYFAPGQVYTNPMKCKCQRFLHSFS